MSAGRWRGVDAIRIAAGEAALVVLPSRGAKIASLSAGGFEWLLQPRAVPPPPAPGEDFVASGLWGWDEMLPTIDASEVEVGGAVRRLPDHGEVWREPWRGTATLPDHGEMWREPWRGTATVPDHGEVWRGAATLSCSGRALPYVIERAIAVAGPRSFAFSYRLSSTAAVPVLWAAHPQFRVPTGCRIVLPDELTSVLDVHAPGGPVARPWTGDPLAALPAGGSAKLYAPPDVPVSWAGLVQADGRWLLMRWDADVAPYLGVWLDRCALAPEPVVALEPASGFYDDLGRALAAGKTSWVRPDAPLRWRLEVEVGDGAPPPPLC